MDRSPEMDAYLRNEPIAARWEAWARDGRVSEVMDDARTLLPSNCDDEEIRDGVFHVAVAHNARKLADALLSLGIDLRGGNDGHAGSDALATAIRSPRPAPDMIAWLIQRGANPNATIMENGSVLELAVNEGDNQIIQALIEGGADINTKDIDAGHMPLEWASAEGRVDTVKLLVKLGATIRLNVIEEIAAERSKGVILEIVRKAMP